MMMKKSRIWSCIITTHTYPTEEILSRRGKYRADPLGRENGTNENVTAPADRRRQRCDNPRQRPYTLYREKFLFSTGFKYLSTPDRTVGALCQKSAWLETTSQLPVALFTLSLSSRRGVTSSEGILKLCTGYI